MAYEPYEIRSDVIPISVRYSRPAVRSFAYALAGRSMLVRSKAGSLWGMVGNRRGQEMFPC